MFLEISGGRKQQRIKTLKDVADAGCLLNLDDNLNLDIYLCTHKHLNQLSDWGASSYIINEDDEFVGIIWINKNLNDEDMRETVFHEMKHIEQFYNGKLVWDLEQNWIFNGVLYLDYEDEADMPWELEAVEFEKNSVL